ncbi:MAG: non-heme iron oxygenase ferredoxin subunit [Actinomycetota bacterium]
MSATTVCRLDEVAPDSAVRRDVNGHRLAIVRIGENDVYVIGDRCSHADYSLSEGELDADELTLECWKHGSTFSLRTGEPDGLPAFKPVPTYEAMVDGDEIKVVLDV